MNRAVLFDFDQTLVDFHPTPARARFDAGISKIYACLTTLGCSLPAYDPFIRRQRRIARRIGWTSRFTHPNGRQFLRRLCADYRLQRDDSSLARLGWLMYEPIAQSAKLAPDVVPTLVALRDADVRLGLVVNTDHMGLVVDRHLGDLGLLDFFPVRVYSTEHGMRKPKAALFNAAIDELRVTAAETIFVGDDLTTDIVGAARAGLRTVLKSADPSRRAQKIADHTIQGIGQLTEIFQLIPEHRAPARPISLPRLVNPLVG